MCGEIEVFINQCQGFPGSSNPPANAGDSRDAGLIPGLGRAPGVGSDNPLQYS